MTRAEHGVVAIVRCSRIVAFLQQSIPWGARMNDRPPFPPFTAETAAQKARAAEDAWNSCEPERISLAYTHDSRWRNRDTSGRGRGEIVAFLRDKWARELEYRLIKEVWTHGDNRIAVRFAYESRDVDGQWFRSPAT